MELFWLLVLFIFVRYMDEKKPLLLIFSSCFAGFSMGSLISYGLIILPIICAIFLYCYRPVDIFRNLVICFACFIGSYLITNPYVVISWKEFIQEIAYIRSYWKGCMNFDNLKYFSIVSLKYGLGAGIWIISIFCFLICLLNFEKKFVPVFLSILPLFIYFGLGTGRWVHYSFLIYPLIFLIMAIGLSNVGKIISMIMLFLTFIWTFLFTFSHVNLFIGENIRTTAGRWINENVPGKKDVGLLESPSPWRTPPFQYLKYNLLIGQPETTGAQYYVISEYQWVRGSSLTNMRKLFADYDIIKEFRKQPELLRWKFIQREDIPYDWCHPNPVILIWKKRT